MPNGFESDGTTPKFDVVIIQNDVVKDTAFGTSTNTMLILVNSLSQTFRNYTLGGNIYSGDSQPVSPMKDSLWYDTANNLLKFTTDSGATWSQTSFSLPIALVHRTSGVADSIDQVFNGFGYIDSTVFALPGVKGLIPNGRNADGSLKNIEVTTNSVLTYTNPSNASYSGSFIITNDLSLLSSDQVYWKYNQQENLFKHESSAGAFCEFSLFEATNGKITSFTPKTAFHAVDRNDSSWLSGLGMPSSRYIDLTLGASGSTYTAPANGWFSCSSDGVVDIILSNQEFSLTITGATGYAPFGYIPVKKGEKFIFAYSSNQNNKIRFYYAEGEAN